MRYIFFLLLIFASTGCEIIGEIFPDLGKRQKIAKQYIDTSLGDIEFTLNDEVSIVFPQGCLKQPELLSVYSFDSIAKYQSDIFTVHKAYSFEFDETTEFDVPVRVSYYYDNELIDHWSDADMFGVYFNEKIEKWELYKNTIIDTISQTISFETKHFSVLGFGEFLSSGGFTNLFETEHFKIYYCASSSNKPLENDEYNNYKINPWTNLDLGVNFMVQDAGNWLEEAYVAYKSFYHLGLPDDNAKVYVYFTNIDPNGEYRSIRNVLYLDSQPKIEGTAESLNMNNEELLKSACAHELLHYFQDNFYNFSPNMRWWLEASATLGDNLVWGNKLRFTESFYFSKYKDDNDQSPTVLSHILSNSWDYCNEEPLFYAAGCFLTYMTFYSETKLNITDALKEIGNDWEVLEPVLLLDRYLEDNHSSSLSDEWVKYVKWIYEAPRNDEIMVFNLPNVPHANIEDDRFDFFYELELDASNNSHVFNTTLPYLSTRVIKMANKVDDQVEATLEIIVKDLDEGTFAYLYEQTREDKSFKSSLIKPLHKGDLVKVSLKGGRANEQEIKEILLINPDVLINKTPEIEIKLLLDNPELINIEPSEAKPGETIILSGKNFKDQMPAGSMVALNGQSMSITSWGDKEIKCTLPSDAVSGYVYVVVDGNKSNELYYEVGNDLVWPKKYFCKEFTLTLGANCGGPSGKTIILSNNDKYLEGGKGTWSYSFNDESKEDINETTDACGKRYTEMVTTKSYSITFTVMPDSDMKNGKFSIDFKQYNKTEKTGDDVKYEKTTNKQLIIKDCPISLGDLPNLNKTISYSTRSDAKAALKYITRAVSDETIITCDDNKSEQTFCTPTEDNINSFRLVLNLIAQ